MSRVRNSFGDGFGLSFLDILCCGLGAAILLLLIVKHEEPGLDDIDWQLMLEPEIFRLNSLISESESVNQMLASKLITLEERFESIVQSNTEIVAELTSQEQKLLNLRVQLAGEQAKLNELRVLSDKLNVTRQAATTESDKFEGLKFGALSGVQLGGEDKVVVLLDTSASMIHWSLVEIIRTQASGVGAIEAAFKWRQAKNIGGLAFSSINPGHRFKVLTFGEEVIDSDGSVVGKDELLWDIKSEKDDQSRLRNLTLQPGGGTNLKLAFDAVSRLIPKPARILLITDGLPNNISNRSSLRGCPKNRKGVSKISGECRISIAINSIDKLSGKLSKVPIDVILLPLEGDGDAVRFYSLLTGLSAGRLITPSVDWLVSS